MIEDDSERNSETGASTPATSVESETSTAHLPSSHLREQPKTHGCLNAHTTTSPLNRLTSASGQTLRRGSHGAAATVDPFRATSVTPPFPEWRGWSGLAQDGEEEWEIMRIVGKRQTGRGYEYKVHWKNTWLPSSELGNAQELLQEFEARARADKG